MTKQQPEALRLADEIDANYFDVTVQCCATELRRQHARIAELEAQTAHMADLVDQANYAHQKMKEAQARVQDLEAALVKESARTANYKLRAEQFEQRLDMANKMGNEAREQLAAQAKQGEQT